MDAEVVVTVRPDYVPARRVEPGDVIVIDGELWKVSFLTPAYRGWSSTEPTAVTIHAASGRSMSHHPDAPVGRVRFGKGGV